MPFRFRLETLLNYRRTLEDQEKQRFAREQAVLLGHKQRLEEMKAARAAMDETLEEQKQHPMTAAMFAYFIESMRVAEQVIIRQENTIAAQMRVVEQARLRLLEKMKEREVMEQFKTRDQERYLMEILNEEMKENDEQAVLRHSKATLASS